MENKKGVIFVDDNDLDLMVGERLVSVIRPDTPLKTFSKGKAFLDWLQSDQFDFMFSEVILLVDIHMPEISGLEVAKQSHVILTSKGIIPKIYLLSASVDKHEVDISFDDSPVSEFIGKPLTKERIIKMLEENS